jgi:hypothetical protein
MHTLFIERRDKLQSVVYVHVDAYAACWHASAAVRSGQTHHRGGDKPSRRRGIIGPRSRPGDDLLSKLSAPSGEHARSTYGKEITPLRCLRVDMFPNTGAVLTSYCSRQGTMVTQSNACCPRRAYGIRIRSFIRMDCPSHGACNIDIPDAEAGRTYDRFPTIACVAFECLHDSECVRVRALESGILHAHRMWLSSYMGCIALRGKRALPGTIGFARVQPARVRRCGVSSYTTAVTSVR